MFLEYITFGHFSRINTNLLRISMQYGIVARLWFMVTYLINKHEGLKSWMIQEATNLRALTSGDNSPDIH